MSAAEETGLPWQRHMRCGAWEAAWRLGDAALAARAGAPEWHKPRHLQAVWDGTPIGGRRVLLRCYHGLGDTLQFIRYAPRVAALAASLTVWAQPALIPLLATMGGGWALLPLHDGAPGIAFDVDVELMELPHLFRDTPASIPAQMPYLHPPQARIPHGPGRQVGLVWRAGEWDPRRSIAPALLRPLLEVPGVTFHVLQRGPALAEWPAGLGVPSGSDDALAAAAVMAALDLVISVDSMPAHLAGALGVPTWLLLAQPADWRWMEGREDSPWYPAMRLFRQPRPGDWRAVIAAVCAALSAWAMR